MIGGPGDSSSTTGPAGTEGILAVQDRLRASCRMAVQPAVSEPPLAANKSSGSARVHTHCSGPAERSTAAAASPWPQLPCPATRTLAVAGTALHARGPTSVAACCTDVLATGCPGNTLPAVRIEHPFACVHVLKHAVWSPISQHALHAGLSGLCAWPMQRVAGKGVQVCMSMRMLGRACLRVAPGGQWLQPGSVGAPALATPHSRNEVHCWQARSRHPYTPPCML